MQMWQFCRNCSRLPDSDVAAHKFPGCPGRRIFTEVEDGTPESSNHAMGWGRGRRGGRSCTVQVTARLPEKSESSVRFSCPVQSHLIKFIWWSRPRTATVISAN